MITKEQISVGKAVAIILMFCHHLFAFSDRIPIGQDLLSITLSRSISIEQEIGVFGKLCVAMFIFMSGLALGLAQKRWSLVSIVERLIPFYSLFLANFIILISASWFLVSSEVMVGHWNGIDFRMRSFLANLFLLNPTYSMEWWFARLYIVIIFLAWPLCELFSRYKLIGLLMLSSTLFSISWLIPTPDNFFFYQFIFTLGFIFSRQIKLFSAPALATRWRLFLLCISVFMISILARRLLGSAWEAILAPICVWAAIWLPVQGTARRVMILIGNNSASMWLNHTFICYYWFRNSFYEMRYTPTLLIALLFVSLLLALATNPLVLIISNQFEWVKEKLRSAKLYPKER
jgi:hypothetical protein